MFRKTETPGRKVSSPELSERESFLGRLLENDLKEEKRAAAPTRGRRSPEDESIRLFLRIRDKGSCYIEDCGSADLVRIGRDRDSDVVLASPYCSRRQCEIFRREEGFMLRNEGRRNPAVLIRGGIRIKLGLEPVRLEHRDILSFGDVRITVNMIHDRRFP